MAHYSGLNHAKSCHAEWNSSSKHVYSNNSCNCEVHSSSFPHPLSTIFGDSLHNISFKSWVSIIDDVMDTEPGYREYTQDHQQLLGVCHRLQFCLFFSWNGKLKITYIKLKDFEVTSEKSCLLYTGVLVVRIWWLPAMVTLCSYLSSSVLSHLNACPCV